MSGPAAGQIVTALVVDDEPLARRRIVDLLATRGEASVIGECATGGSAVESVRHLDPDLLFLDVQMPDIDGFEVLAALEPDERPLVIFSTAYDEYAVAAFEVHAIDYLLKPFSDERFDDALRRALDSLGSRRVRESHERVRNLLSQLGLKGPRSGESGSVAYLERFAVPGRERHTIVEAHTVDWIEAARDYVILHADGQRHLLRGTMSAIEERLDPSRFVRIHRSAIVNVTRVRHLQTDANGTYVAVLASGKRLRVGRRYSDSALRRLGLRW